MRVLLTGGSGFVGGHVAPRLAADGHELRLLVRPTSDTSFVDDLSLERVRGDLRQPETLAAACQDMDAVVHAAAVLRAVQHNDFMRANRRGTGDLAAAAADAGVKRFIYISSIAAQGPAPGSIPESPEAPLHPVSAYGRSKAAGEEEVLKQRGRMQLTILRPPLVYGPADNGLLTFFWMARRGFCIRLGNGSNVIDAISAGDLSEAVSSLLRSELPEVARYHVCDDSGPHSWNELLAALESAADRGLWIPSVPAGFFHGLARCSEWWAALTRSSPVLDRARVTEMRQPFWICDPSTLKRDTGWQPKTSIEDGLRETMAWYQEHGWI